MRLVIVIGIALAASSAAAESKVDALFKKGKEQLAAKKYAEACATFEEVDKLEPGIGAKLNVARCYEEWEKLAIAYRWYSDAKKMAVDTKDKRAPKIKELVETLDTDVPRLTIKLPAKIDPSAAAVQLDGKPLPIEELGKEQLVDPGPHEVEYVSGTATKKRTIKLERGASSEIELVFDSGPPIKKEVPTPVPPSTGSNRKLYGVISGATGVAMLGVAGVLTLTARDNYNDALADHCMGETNLCDDKGNAITKRAKTRANIATVVSIVGVAAVATGVVLYLTAPKGKTSTEKRAYLAPSVGEGGAAVILGGCF